MKTEKVLLGDIAEFIRGINFKPDDVVAVGTPASVVCMRTKNVQTEIDLSDIWAVNKSFVKKEKQLLQVGDILVSSANSWNLVGKCCWIPELPWQASFGGFVTVLRPHKEKVNQNFLYRWFASDRVQALLRSFGQKTTNISNLNIDRCLKLELDLPPIAEQKRIAEILDRTQSLISKRKEAIAKLDTLTQSIFLEMFGDPELKGWHIETVNDVVHPSKGSIRTGPFGSQLLHSEFVTEGIAVLGIDNAVANEFRWGERRFISEAKYQELKRYTVKPNDVIITIMGTCGKCAIVPEDIPLSINTKHLCCITLNQKKCLPRFLQAYFLFHPISNRYLEQTKKGAIMSGLNMSIIQAMPIFSPPLPLQKEFAQRVEAVEKLKATHRASLSQLEALFASLQHRAFRGEL